MYEDLEVLGFVVVVVVVGRAILRVFNLALYYGIILLQC